MEAALGRLLELLSVRLSIDFGWLSRLDYGRFDETCELNSSAYFERAYLAESGDFVDRGFFTFCTLFATFSF